MRKAPFAALALGVALAAAPPAVAGDDSRWGGDCGYDTVTDPTWQVGDPDRYHGVLYGYAAVYSPSDPATPVSATITCTMSVAGEPLAEMSATGTTVVAGAAPVDFVVAPDQYIEFCLSIDFADDTPSDSICYAAIPILVPPDEVFEFPGDTLSEVPAALDAVCGVLRTGVVPDLGRAVSTGDDGDLYVTDRRVVDCPPQD